MVVVIHGVSSSRRNGEPSVAIVYIKIPLKMRASDSAAMRDAASPAAKARLQGEPVKASWRDATNELVRQYKEIINSNLPNRQVRATIMGALDSLLRAILGTLCAYWVVRSYTKRSFKIGVYLLDNYVLEYL